MGRGNVHFNYSCILVTKTVLVGGFEESVIKAVFLTKICFLYFHLLKFLGEGGVSLY